MNTEILTQFSYNPDNGELRRKGRLCRPRADGYIRVTVNYTQYYAHRVIWLLMTGDWPVGEVDHINRNPRDNSWVNLRDVSRQVNAQNISSHTGATTRIPGVLWDAPNQRFRAYIQRGGKQYMLISTKDFFEAVCARKSAEVIF